MSPWPDPVKHDGYSSQILHPMTWPGAISQRIDCPKFVYVCIYIYMIYIYIYICVRAFYIYIYTHTCIPQATATRILYHRIWLAFYSHTKPNRWVEIRGIVTVNTLHLMVRSCFCSLMVKHEGHIYLLWELLLKGKSVDNSNIFWTQTNGCVKKGVSQMHWLIVIFASKTASWRWLIQCT